MGGLTGKEGKALAWLDQTFGRYGKRFTVAEAGALAGGVKTKGRRCRGRRYSRRSSCGYCRPMPGRKTLFVTWFLCRDYDALWEKSERVDAGGVCGVDALRAAGRQGRAAAGAGGVG